MDKEKIKQVVEEGMEHMTAELKQLNSKQRWSASDTEYFGKLLEPMEKAVCVKQMLEEGEGYSGRRGYSGDGYSQRRYPMGRSYNDGRSYDDGYSEQMRAANGQYRSGDEYSGHSVDDRVIAMLEEMAGRAGSDYERDKIRQKIEMLHRMN